MRIFAIVFAILYFGCTPTKPASEMVHDARDGGLSEPQILELTRVIHQDEIDLAKLALQRATRADVKAFAEQMVTEHGEGITRGGALAAELGLTLAPSEASREQQEHGNDVTKKLGEKTGADFDKAYAEAMVDGHQDVLDKLEDKLIPAASNDKLKAELHKLQASVSAHLAHALKLVAASP